MIEKDDTGLKRLVSQAVTFIGLSGIGWILDFCIYTGLGFVSENLIINNVISSWAGVTFVFFFAIRKVFDHNNRISVKWKYLIYILYQCILIFFISRLLSVINMAIADNITIGLVLKFSSIIAKILVTPITMFLNFFVMGIVIEKL